MIDYSKVPPGCKMLRQWYVKWRPQLSSAEDNTQMLTRNNEAGGRGYAPFVLK